MSSTLTNLLSFDLQPLYSILMVSSPSFVHSLVFSDGSICLDIIKDKWQPIYTVSSVLASIMVSLLFLILCVEFTH